MPIKKRVSAHYDAEACPITSHADVEKNKDEDKECNRCILVNAIMIIWVFALYAYPSMMSFSSENLLTKQKVNMPTFRASKFFVRETFSKIECNASEDSISALMKGLQGKENIALGKEAIQSSTGNGQNKVTQVNDVNNDASRNCGCPHTCTETVLARRTKFGCEERIKFLMRRYKHPHLKACRDASLDIDSPCGDGIVCNPDVCPKSPSLAGPDQPSLGPAQKAVDGNTDQSYSSGSVSATTTENNPWWQVDLGAVYNLEKVVIYNRADARSKDLKRFYVDILNANADGSWEIEDHVYSEDEAGLVALVTFKKGIKGQVVRIRVDGHASINLAEVEVYGVAIG